MNSGVPSIAADYFRTVNQQDATGFIALFALDASVNDNGREICGLDQIRSWSDREIFAANVTLDIMNSSQRNRDAVITTEVDGDFDRTGLPDPVVIEHCIQITGDRIARLTCKLVQ